MQSQESSPTNMPTTTTPNDRDSHLNPEEENLARQCSPAQTTFRNSRVDKTNSVSWDKSLPTKQVKINAHTNTQLVESDGKEKQLKVKECSCSVWCEGEAEGDNSASKQKDWENAAEYQL